VVEKSLNWASVISYPCLLLTALLRVVGSLYETMRISEKPTD
jgi:hypothetical protein